MPQIKVHVYASLRRHVNNAACVDVEIEPGRTIRQVLSQLQVPAEETRIVFINHRAAKLDDALHGGERVDLFSAIGGG